MISDSTPATLSREGELEHAVRYEVLRTQAMARPAMAPRHGLAVLLRRGVAAWMDAWSALPAPAERPRREEYQQQSSPLPDNASAEVVRVLASMALGHIEEVYT